MSTKLTFLPLLACLLMLTGPVRSQWMPLGNSFPMAESSRLAATVDGVLYLARNLNDTLFLHRFDGSQWQQVSAYSDFPGTFFSFAVNKAGVPYIATDSANSLFVIRYDGANWIRTGDASRIQGITPSFETQLAFDSSDRPFVSMYQQADLVRFDGVAWQEIGSKTPGTTYHSITADHSGRIYAFNNRLEVLRHITDTAWDNLGTASIKTRSRLGAVLGVNEAGKIHVAYGDYLDSISMHEYSNGSWARLGNVIPRTNELGSTILFGHDNKPYLVFNLNSGTRGDFDLVRFNGRDWVNVDTTGLGDAIYRTTATSDRQGNIYLGISDAVYHRNFRIMKYDTRNDGVSVPVAPRVQAISAVPVPATNELLVRCTDPELKNKSATIVDMQGRTIQQFRLSPETRISTASWPSGVYQILLPDGNSLKVVRQ